VVIFVSEAAYDYLSIFETDEEHAPKLRLVKKSNREAKKHAKKVARSGAKVVAIALVLLSAVGAMLFQRTLLSEGNSKINDLGKRIEEKQGAIDELDMRIESLIPIAKVEEYATSVLGMLRPQSTQVEMIVPETSGIVSSGENGKKAKSGIQKILEYFF
jgi:cell division protein FtsL